MKSLIALLCSLVVAVAGYAQSAASASKSAPSATKSGAEKKAEATKEEPKIEGQEVSRGEKGFLGVQIVEGTFKINFYDAKKKPVAVDVARALLRWDPKNKVGQERVVLNPSADGKSLSSSKPIAPPYNFKLFIVLSKQGSDGQDPTPETYVIDFRA